MSRAYKHEMLLIGLSDERSVTRYAAIVVTHLCSMTPASGGICTSIACRVFKSARTPKTAAALARSFEQRKISIRRPFELLLVGVAKGIQQYARRRQSLSGQVVIMGRRVLLRHPRYTGAKHLENALVPEKILRSAPRTRQEIKQVSNCQC